MYKLYKSINYIIYSLKIFFHVYLCAKQNNLFKYFQFLIVYEIFKHGNPKKEYFYANHLMSAGIKFSKEKISKMTFKSIFTLYANLRSCNVTWQLCHVFETVKFFISNIYIYILIIIYL